jgi:tRNA nucleotidyltransferase/poly(A) polymerase
MTYEEFKQSFLPELLKLRSFSAKMKYANEHLQRIGSGSGRIVYDIDGEKVLKLAKNSKGIAQNETEANAGYYRDTQDTVAIVFDNADDDSWLIAEEAKKVNEARIKQLTGIPSLNELFYFLRNYEQQAKGKREIFPQDPQIEEFMWENEFANGLAQFVANYGQVSGDMGRPSSYGEVFRNGQPTIVLTDYDTHYAYNPKKQMYELFTMGDVDNNILGNMPPEDGVDTRHDMWGFMPYSVDDGDGVINEEFLSFVEKHDKYPEAVLENTPYMLDEFHNIINNLKAVMESVQDKQKFYSNLLELQDYLIRGKFYDRAPLLKTDKQPKVNEDGSALYSTENSFGQDNFPVYNNIDDSPVTDNNIPTSVDEDLEYRHASDATKDEYVINERKKSYMPGSQAVEVKKKCRLGGLGNTSVACNQGDIGNLNFKSIDESKFGDYKKQIAADNITHGLDKELIRTYDDGIDVNPVYAVNGDEVRDSGFIEWVEGGNHWVDADLPKDEQKYAKHIPADELWIDDVHLSKPNDFEAILLHERIESYLIKHYGYTYNDAHDIANKVELIFREKTHDLSDEKESERISSLMFTAFKKHFKPKGDKKFRNEDVGIDFINEPIHNYSDKLEKDATFEAENESIMNEAQIMSLQNLPFKKEIEGLGGKIYSVGGAVRDEFLGKESKDLDILITGVTLEQLEQILGKYGRVDAVGKSFGILKFKPKGATEDIDVAIPRTETLVRNMLDPSMGVHKAFDVKSDPTLPIETDLERRDFTINAIAKDIDGNIVDPFGGQEDLKNKIIRAVNPEAFNDDPLRMLRAVQFASRFGFTIEPETLKMIQENANKIKGISPERILTEFDKIIKKGNAKIGADLLMSTGLYQQIFGGAQNNLSQRISQVKTMGEFIYLLSTGVVQNPAEFYLKNLKGDLDTYKEIKALEIAFTLPDISIPVVERSFAHNMYLLSPLALQSQIIPVGLQKASQEFQQGKYPKTVNELAVNGNDLVGIGLKGKAIGDMQKSLLVKVYADKVRNSKEELLNLARQNDIVKEEVEQKPLKKMDYGCLMLFLDIPVWNKITSVIDPDDVLDVEGYGIETEPHTTILYGFHPEVTPEEVFDLFKLNIPVEPIKVGISGISIFSNPEFDVVKFDVESPILNQANKIMSDLPNTNTFPEYHPHITIAYVKKGTGHKYVKPFEKQRMLIGNKLVYSFAGKTVGTLMLDEQNVQESVADRYAQKAFNIPDPNAQQDVQAAGAVQAQADEPIAYVKGRDTKKTPIFENPRSLTNFGANVRGIIDQEGNMFVAQRDGSFNHGDMGKAMGLIESDTEAMYKYLTEWTLINRIQDMNAFGLADSSADFAEDEYDYDNMKIVTDFLRAAKRKNPQYDFYNEYYEHVMGKPISLDEFAFPELGLGEKYTWNVDGQEVGIQFFVEKYDIWNQDAYLEPSDFTVIEFLHNEYPEFAKDEKLKKELLWALTDRNILDEEEDMNRKVLYTAVVLDDKSRAKLLQRLGNMIPEGWETIAHHMTINLGAIKPEYRKFLGMTVAMDAVDFAADDKVMAVGVVIDGIPTINAKPHITLAVN